MCWECNFVFNLCGFFFLNLGVTTLISPYFLQQWSPESSECSTESPSQMGWAPTTGGWSLQGGTGLDHQWAEKQSSVHRVGPGRPWWDHQYPFHEESFMSQVSLKRQPKTSFLTAVESIVESNPRKFHLDIAELSKRKQFISNTRQIVKVLF